MPAPDRHREIALARAWPLLAALVSAIMALIGLTDTLIPDRLSRAIRLQALRLLRPAEALARRLIVLMAQGMAAKGRSCHGERRRPTAGPGSPPPALSRVHRGANRRGDQSQKPHFRLFEPLPAIAATFRASKPPAPRSNPRILSLDDPCPADQARPEPSPARLIARLSALKAVLDDPERRAKRHARFLARRLQANRPTGRLSPLRPGWPPGARSRHTPGWLKEKLLDTAQMARAGPS